MTARLLNLTPAEYRAGPIDAPWLSQSYAHILISQSQLHAWAAHPLLGGVPRSTSDALTDGQIIHKFILEKGADIAIAPAEWPDAKGKMLPAVEWRTNSAKEWKENALAEGKLPLLQHEASAFNAAAEMIEARFRKLGIPLDASEKEISITWDEQGRHGPVHCCAMLDLLVLETGDIFDFKSTRSATLKSCRRAMTDYGYYLQDVVYRRAVNALKPELEGRARMHFVFAELEPPYAVSKPRQTSNAMREMGQRDWRRAVLTWEKCLLTDKWPGPDEDDSTDILEPMPYALTDAMERDDGEEVQE